MPVMIGLLLATPAGAADPDLDRITALAKIFFRDSAELPMDVSVNTVVTDPAGKVKRRAQSSVRLLFHGYSQQSGTYRFNSRSGWFSTWALRDSLVGDFATFSAGTFLAPKENAVSHLAIQRPTQPGGPLLVTFRDEQCPEFKLLDGYLFPKEPCASGAYRLRSLSGNDLEFQDLSFDIANLPAAAKIAYLGAVQISSFHVDADFQKVLLPGDPKPFLIPKTVTTTITTDKGKIAITNAYAPRIARR